MIFFFFILDASVLKCKIPKYLKFKTITRAQTSVFCRLQELLSLSPGKLPVGLGSTRAEVEDEMNQQSITVNAVCLQPFVGLGYSTIYTCLKAALQIFKKGWGVTFSLCSQI